MKLNLNLSFITNIALDVDLFLAFLKLALSNS